MINVKRKGYIGEYESVKKFKSYGFEVNRVFASGSIEQYKGDIILKVGKYRFNFECKNYKRISIFRWWDKHKREIPSTCIPGLILKESDNDRLVAIAIDDFCMILSELEEVYKFKKQISKLK